MRPIALTSGHFEEASPEATLELSNLGRCENLQMHTAQRYDGYDGVSCMAHTESTGLRWTVSMGPGLFSVMRSVCCTIHDTVDNLTDCLDDGT